ncbi:MAG: hypothetical protein SGPRY_009937, partial [Prymnesium sp.]
ADAVEATRRRRSVTGAVLRHLELGHKKPPPPRTRHKLSAKRATSSSQPATKQWKRASCASESTDESPIHLSAALGATPKRLESSLDKTPASNEPSRLVRCMGGEGKQAQGGEGDGIQAQGVDGVGKQAQRGEGEGKRAQGGEGESKRAQRGEGEGKRAQRGEGEGKRAQRGEGEGKLAQRGEGEGKRAQQGEAEGSQVQRGGGEETRTQRGEALLSPSEPSVPEERDSVSTCQTLELCSTEEDALALRKIKLAIVEQQRAHLASIRRWWYKPVAILGNQLFSIEDGQAVEFVIGKRMMCAMQAEPPRKVGYLVYDCVARALQQCVLRPKGRLTAAPLAMLTAWGEEDHRSSGYRGLQMLTTWDAYYSGADCFGQVSQPCAPRASRWPTESGVWAFKVRHSGLSIEHQSWMELEKQWRPTSAPGLCRQCALAERV